MRSATELEVTAAVVEACAEIDLAQLRSVLDFAGWEELTLPQRILLGLRSRAESLLVALATATMRRLP